jgi:hypothetical protein
MHTPIPILLLLLLGALCSGGAEVVSDPGLAVSIGDSLWRLIGADALDAANHALTGLAVPAVDIDKDGFTVKADNIAVLLFDAPVPTAADPAALSVSPAAHGLSMRVSQFYGGVGCDWSFRRDSWPHLSGDGVGTLVINKTDVSFALSFAAAPARGGKNVFRLNATDVSVTVGGGELSGFPSEVHLTAQEVAKGIAGGIVAGIAGPLDKVLANPASYNLRLPFASSPAASSQRRSSQQRETTATTTTTTTTTTGLRDARPRALLDVSPTGTSPVSFEGREARFAVRGVVDGVTPHASTVAPAPAVPWPASSASSSFSIAVSAWTIASITAAADQAGAFHTVIEDTKAFNTTMFRFVIPAFFKAYPDCAFRVVLDSAGPPLVNAVGAGGASTLNIDVFPATATFEVLPPSPAAWTEAFVLNATASAAVTVTAANRTTVTAAVAGVEVAWAVASTKIGPFSLLGFDIAAEAIKLAAVAKINAVLATGFAVPTLRGGWALAGLRALGVQPGGAGAGGYIVIEANVTQVPPHEPPVVCPTGNGCPLANTCCKPPSAKGKSADDTCCPYAAATCCAGYNTCCPHGYGCVNDGTACLPFKAAASHINNLTGLWTQRSSQLPRAASCSTASGGGVAANPHNTPHSQAPRSKVVVIASD